MKSLRETVESSLLHEDWRHLTFVDGPDFYARSLIETTSGAIESLQVRPKDYRPVTGTSVSVICSSAKGEIRRLKSTGQVPDSHLDTLYVFMDEDRDIATVRIGQYSLLQRIVTQLVKPERIFVFPFVGNETANYEIVELMKQM